MRPGSKVDLALSQIGMVVRSGAALPNIDTVEAFRRTLLAAKSIGYSDSGSGTYLSTTLFAKLGVANQVAGKSRKVRGHHPVNQSPRSLRVVRWRLASSKSASLIHVPGVTYVGPIPAELQAGFSFAGAITSAVTAGRGSRSACLPRFAPSGVDYRGLRADTNCPTVVGVFHVEWRGRTQFSQTQLLLAAAVWFPDS